MYIYREKLHSCIKLSMWKINRLLKCVSDSFGNAEINKLFLSLELKGNSSVGDFRHSLWIKFQQSL